MSYSHSLLFSCNEQSGCHVAHSTIMITDNRHDEYHGFPTFPLTCVVCAMHVHDANDTHTHVRNHGTVFVMDMHGANDTCQRETMVFVMPVIGYHNGRMCHVTTDF